ncbi:MAG: DUF3352 domain-containing protein [Mycobacteriales bacterium]
MSDEQPPTGPHDPNPPADAGWAPPPPPSTPPGSFGPPSAPPSSPPPAYEQPPGYQAPTEYGAQPTAAQPFALPYAQQAYGQQTYGAAGYGDQLATPPVKSKRGLALGAGALALAAVAAGGIYVASQAGDEGKQPESLVPSTALAFAKIDLDPPADQKLAIHEFSKKFPSGPKTTADDPMDGFLREIFKDESGNCNYETDIKPWLGKRVGIAAIAGSKGKTEPLLLLEVKDEEKAKAAKSKLTSDVCDSDEPDASSEADDDLRGFAIKDGFAVLSTEQADVDAALAAAKTESLESSKTFKDDMAKLEGNQIVVVWADAGRVYDEIAKEQPKLKRVPNGLTKQIKGRLVMGMHVSNNYGEIYARVIGSDMAAVKVTKPTALGKLPQDTIAAISVTELQAQIEAQLSALGATSKEVDDVLASASKQLGISIRKELLPLLGNQTLIALGNIPTSPADTKIGIASVVDDPAAAAKAGKKLAALAKQAGLNVDVEVDGTTFYLTTKGYAEALKGDGGLDSTPLFTAAMGPLGDEVAGATYIDLGQLVELMQKRGDDTEGVNKFSAFGMSAGKVGDDGYVRMRLVVK